MDMAWLDMVDMAWMDTVDMAWLDMVDDLVGYGGGPG